MQVLENLLDSTILFGIEKKYLAFEELYIN